MKLTLVIPGKCLCEVCGKQTHIHLIRDWNAKKACTSCINELTQEITS